MTARPNDPLSRRGSQIMSILWELKGATADEIRAALPDDLHDSTVRTLLRQLEEKGHIKHRLDGRQFVYLPVSVQTDVQTTALESLLSRFFSGSARELVLRLIRDERLKPEDLEAIRQAARGPARRPKGDRK